MGFDCHITISADNLTKDQANVIADALGQETEHFEGFSGGYVDFGVTTSHPDSEWFVEASQEFDSVRYDYVIKRATEIAEANQGVTLTVYYIDDDAKTRTHIGPEARTFELKDAIQDLTDAVVTVLRFTDAEIEAANLDDFDLRLVTRNR